MKEIHNYKQNLKLKNTYVNLASKYNQHIDMNLTPWITYDQNGQYHCHWNKAIDPIKSVLIAKSKGRKLSRQLKKYIKLYYSFHKSTSDAFTSKAKNRFHVFSLLITTSSKYFRWIKCYKPYLADQKGRAVDNLHSAMQSLRKNVINKNNHLMLLLSHPVIKYPKDLHDHGILLVISSKTDQQIKRYVDSLNSKLTCYLSSKLGYSINTAPNVKLIRPLVNYQNNRDVVYSINDQNNSNDKSIADTATYNEKSDSVTYDNGQPPKYKRNKQPKQSNFVNAPEKLKALWLCGSLNSLHHNRKRYRYRYPLGKKIKQLKQKIKSIKDRQQSKLTSRTDKMLLFNVLNVKVGQSVYLFDYSKYTLSTVTLKHKKQQRKQDILNYKYLVISKRKIAYIFKIEHAFVKDVNDHHIKSLITKDYAIQHNAIQNYHPQRFKVTNEAPCPVIECHSKSLLSLPAIQPKVVFNISNFITKIKIELSLFNSS